MKHLFIKLIIILAVLNLSSHSACAQWPVFRVYHISGTIKYKSSGQSHLKPLTKSAYLYQRDTILLINNNADIILFDRDTNYIQIRLKGKYSVAEIQDMQKTHIKDDITIKYIKLLWEELFKPDEGGFTNDDETISSSTAGVSRGLSIVIAPGDRYRTSMDVQWFRWKKISWAKSYRLRLTNQNKTECYNKLTTDTQAYVHFTDSMPYGNLYMWNLKVIGDGSQTMPDVTGYLELIDEKKVLPGISKSATDSLKGIAHDLSLIGLYEDHGCIKKAADAYQLLLKKYPEDRALKKLYHAFLSRNFLVP
jgi:hypothetical protein